MADIGKFLDKAYEGKEFSELAKSPVSALQGVSEADAAALKTAFGINTIADLANSKFVLWAQAITALSSGATADDASAATAIRQVPVRADVGTVAPEMVDEDVSRADRRAAPDGPSVHDRQLVVVANRLPVARVDGEWRSSPGGLVRALLGFLRPTAALWVGWAGAADDPEDRFEVDGIEVATVPLSAEQISGFYDGVSNDAIWPLYHDALRPSTYDADDWRQYVEVNERFAERTAAVAEPHAVVWVHDYQLQLVPKLLRDLRPDLRIGFFLHIPFPPQELFMRFPWREEVLDGLLGADLVGFQRRVAADNFVALAHRLVGADIDGDDLIAADGRRVHVGAFAVSIDIAEIAAIADDPATIARAQRIRSGLGDPPTVLLGVDRLDYTKGIVERLVAFRELLRERSTGRDHLERPDLVLVQLAVPSREQVGDYLAQREHVEQLVGAVNGEFATLGHPAVHYLHRSLPLDQLVALYLVADVMVVTPLRDGMNLVAKEFVAARQGDGGVLLLSEFAGAVDEFADAVIVNPHDPQALVAALDTAVSMRPAEAVTRMAGLSAALAANDAQDWAASFIARLVE